MSLAAVISDVVSGTTPLEGDAPEDDGRPDDEPEPTTLNTPRMVPPHIHNQDSMNRSLVTMVATAMTILGFIEMVS